MLTESAFALGNLNSEPGHGHSWLERTIALKPNSAHAFGRGAIVPTFTVAYENAADHSKRAMRLSPFDTLTYIFTKPGELPALSPAVPRSHGLAATIGAAKQDGCANVSEF